MSDTKNLPVGSRIDHDRYGEGVISETTFTSYNIIFVSGGERSINKAVEDLSVVSIPEGAGDGGGESDFTFADMEYALEKVLEKHNAIQSMVELGDKWNGGTMTLKPEDDSLSSKEIPIESFFHKIVMLRDRIRVMEQKINSNDKLTDEDKVELQQYITRCYGSLTTFNVLFKHKGDHFKGAGKG